MLQIASGKLFSQPPAQRNELRGVIHTNLQMSGGAAIETAAGRLLPTHLLRTPNTLVYEVVELIEDAPAPGVVASHGIDPYLTDFAMIVSFALRVTCTPDVELFRRLTNPQASILADVPPRILVARQFDNEVWCKDDDAQQLVDFVHALIGLKRKAYLVCMRSIRTYVNALHRLVDDPELAYTMLVASIESLSQGFHPPTPTWEDYPEHKRSIIDDALTGADQETEEKVRNAVLEIEHVALSRRFREFALGHVQPSYFRRFASNLVNPIGHADLPGALNQAYSVRSKYVHRLKELPKLLTAGFSAGDSLYVDGNTMLTFQGISRLARHLIMEFVRGQPKVASESYDYRAERSGIIASPLAPEYWIGKVESLTANSGRVRLEGFLAQVMARLRDPESPNITDLRDVLVKVEGMLQRLNEDQRRPFVVLYILFNSLVIPEAPMENYDAIVARYGGAIEGACLEGMLLHLLQGVLPTWDLEEHQRVHDTYLREQGRRTCLRVPREIRASFSLALGERYRALGAADRARDLLSTAVENHPGDRRLNELEVGFEPEKPLNWQLSGLPAELASSPRD